ncbi:hypothetical protein F52700_5912 [Fusarium sp. NRRL 52700]|nr:hypothetical protein F52700_5912 [Fusarium sp. NRRL 52700]
MSSDLTSNAMSDLDIYLTDRDGTKAAASKWANSPEDWAEIRRKCSYVRIKWYFPMLESLGPVPEGLTKPLGTPSADMNLFEKLPSDVMNSILCLLDLESFLSFRNVNAKAHSLTENVLDCKEVIVHGSAAVVNLARTGLSGHFTIGEIHLALTSPKCGICEGYGSLLFLPTCTRTCHECLRTSPRMAMTTTEEILPFYSRFFMYRGHGNRRHLIKSLPKTSMAAMKVRDPLRPRRMLKSVLALPVDDLFFYSSELGLDMSDPVEFDPVRFLLDKEWLQYRAAATIHFPFFNTATGEVEQGRSCRGCQEAHQNGLVPTDYERDRCYSHKEFQDHFETCEHAQRIWLSRALPGREAWFAANGGMLWGIQERADYCRRFEAQVPIANNEGF